MNKQLKENEERALQTGIGKESALQFAAAPEIVNKLESESNAYAKARKIKFFGDEMKVPYETVLEDAKFIATQNAYAPEINFNVSNSGELKQKRAAIAMAFSKLFAYDSGVDLVKYTKKTLTKRMAKALEKSILAGTLDYEFKGIAPDPNVVNVSIAKIVTEVNLRSIYLKVHEDVLSNSSWYMSRPFFEKASALLDGTGGYLIKNIQINGKIVPTLFGFPIEVSNALDAGDISGQVPVLFGSIEDCYTIAVKKDLEIKDMSGDTTHALRGSMGFLAEFLGDGMVTNYQAIAKGAVV